MPPSNIRAFELLVANSPELQAQLSNIRSPLELITLAQEQDLELTGEDLREIAQTAYHNWVITLDLPVRNFFERAQQSEAINSELKQCQSPADAIDLASRNGLEIAVSDLQQAATAAAAIPGFSFEKLWFKKLGLL